jgi:hypothetical protein
MKNFVVGLMLGVILSASVVSLAAQNERALHPRIAKAIEALKDAKAYMQAAPHDFGGHRAEAIRASDEAIKQLDLALAYRAGRDARGK